MVIESCSENIDSTSNDSVTTLLNISFPVGNSSYKDYKTSDEIIKSIDNIVSVAQKALNSIIDKKTFHAMKLCNISFIVSEKYNAALLLCDQLREYIDQLYKSIWISQSNTINKHNFERQSFISDTNEPPLEEINSLVNQVLISVEKLYKKHSDIQTENEDNKLLKYLIIQPLSEDLKDCDLVSINKQLKNVLKLGVGDNVLRSCLPLFEQYALLVQYFITLQTTIYRVLSKMNYLLSSLFTDLASNGFCLPDELLDDDNDADQSDGKCGMGLSEGEGTKDVSDQIESQDQLEDAKKDYNDQQESEKDLKEEDNGVEMSDDFEGKLHDLDNDDAKSSDDENDDFNQDKEMGETGENAETLDEKLWSSDSEDENGDEQENQDLKEDTGEGGESMGDKQIGAKSDSENIEELDNKEEKCLKNSKKDINEELNEDGKNAGEDHTDSLHNDLKPPPEPEQMDLPNDLQLDEGEINDNDNCDENPFDIDHMKENTESCEKDNELLSNDDSKKDPETMEDTSDDDEDGNKIDDSNCNSNEDETEEIKENDEHVDGGQKDENKTGEDPREEVNEPNVETAKPSEDTPSQVETQPSNFETSGSKDQVCDKPNGQDNNENIERNKEESTGPEQQGIGRSQGENKDTQEGHNTNEDKGSQSTECGSKEKKRKMKPGETNLNRTLAETNGPMEKRLKTTNADDENIDTNEDDDIDKKKGELFKHVKDSKKSDTETLDAATNEQLEKRPMPNNENEKGDDLKKEDEIELEKDIDEIETQNGEEILPEKIKPRIQNNQSSINNLDQENENFEEEPIVTDGEIILTHTVERGVDTMFHTVGIKEDNSSIVKKDHKEYIKNQLDKWFDDENKEIQKDETWNKCVEKTSCLAQELSEQLRLVLEPSKASRLQGDFRTGRRINMRRVIPFIASQFKKDKIWLRRTRPSKRQYQIIMGVDNSCSMFDCHANSLAFEALALVSKALTLVEAGELGVMSFGEKARIIHPLGEPFGDQTGVKLIKDFTFNEQKTKVGELIELATAIFEDRGRLDTSDRPAQLLVIISDGRGIKCEGPDYVKNAIRAAKLIGIFIVFIVVDNPTSKESILDIKMPVFENNSVRIESYMDNFPFPFYVILRDVDKLPGVLSDALREWFELVTY